MWTAARNDAVFFAYLVAIPRPRIIDILIDLIFGAMLYRKISLFELMGGCLGCSGATAKDSLAG